jgi:hypothetical protein
VFISVYKFWVRPKGRTQKGGQGKRADISMGGQKCS